MISFKIESSDESYEHKSLHKAISWIGPNTNGQVQIFTDEDWIKTKTYWVTFSDSQDGVLFKLTWSDKVKITAFSSPE